MKFYVASSFKNVDQVRHISEKLMRNGFIHTYDWTQHEEVSTIEQLSEIGQKEKDAVIEADFIVVILPAGKGSHIELGIALGQGKKVYLYCSTDEINNLDTTSTFYHLDEVEKCIGTVDELIDHVTCKTNVS